MGRHEIVKPDVLLRILASPSMPRRLVEALVRAFARWHVRQVVRADRRRIERAGAKPPLEGPLYLLDGYHGGAPFWDWILLPRGGLWNALLWPSVGELVVRRAREAKLPAVLELDAHTYATMANGQPEPLARLADAANAGTLELVNRTFSQPFLRTVSGDVIQGGPLPYEDGAIRVPEGPGLGVRLDPEKLAQYNQVYEEYLRSPVVSEPREGPIYTKARW